MPKNLLLADDSITIQKVVGITFANEDYQVVAVSDGEAALVRARELRPDVILADVVMPKRNGYEVCEAVKADPSLAHIPVVLLAGTFEAFDEARARSARADGHISKPFESQALINKVRELVEGKAAVAAPGALLSRPAMTTAPRPAAPAPAPARPNAISPGERPGAFVPPAGARPAGMSPGFPPATAPRPGFVAAPPAAARPGGPFPAAGPAAARPGAGVPPGARPGTFPPGAMPAARGMPPVAPSPGAFRPGAPPPGARPAAAAPYPGAPAPQTRPAASPFPPRPAAPASFQPRPAAPASFQPRPAAPAVQPAFTAPAAPVAPAGRKDPFGFGVPVAPAPAAPRADDDWSDVDMGEPDGATARPDLLGRDPAPAPRAPIELPPDEVAAPELAPMHEFVPAPSATGHAPAAATVDGGEAVLREALSKASREVIERIVWEVVPELAETIIRENLDRLVKSRQG